ncbi:glycosyltransferase [Flavobacterium branchiophilum]|uniref:Glycosyltransferase 2-like domain-containing protein n=1 Tax=Flavobacterium branchiophilum TaxID=55197 RepID=A0A2H3KPU8_9FLAO|nr:glycosyltransferase family 2 protein [Flavobacterium branchiophilum]PDS23410.1 hypothetical protein B0A77_10935 [Flavobacterium branchiophilum]
MNLQLSVIIVNYNGMRFLDACFNSLYDKLSTLSYEIIVIDNNSTDESCSFIKENYKNIKLIESKENLGFGGGNNLGILYSKYENILLINNDTILLDPLDDALNILDHDKSIGAITIQMLDDQQKYVPSFGNFPNVYNMIWLAKLQNLGLDLVTGVFKQNSYELDWLSGSFILMKKEIYLKVGGFDVDYFMYVEDVDFSKKLANLRLKRVFLPNYQYIHFVGFNKSKNPLLIKGFMLFIEKHQKGIYKRLLQMALQVNKTIKIIKNEY